jgi:hypothetical protein
MNSQDNKFRLGHAFYLAWQIPNGGVYMYVSFKLLVHFWMDL